MTILTYQFVFSNQVAVKRTRRFRDLTQWEVVVDDRIVYCQEVRTRVVFLLYSFSRRINRQ